MAGADSWHNSLLLQVGSVDFQMPGTLMVRGYNCSVTDPNWEDQWSLVSAISMTDILH